MPNRTTIICLTTLLALAVQPIATAEPPAEQKKATFLDHLKPGQMVSLQEKDGRYEVTLLPQGFQPLPYTVIDVGPDFITFRDLAHIIDTVVPIYSIKSIKIIHVPGK